MSTRPMFCRRPGDPDYQRTFGQQLLREAPDLWVAVTEARMSNREARIELARRRDAQP